MAERYARAAFEAVTGVQVAEAEGLVGELRTLQQRLRVADVRGGKGARPENYVKTVANVYTHTQNMGRLNSAFKDMLWRMDAMFGGGSWRQWIDDIWPAVGSFAALALLVVWVWSSYIGSTK